MGLFSSIRFRFGKSNDAKIGRWLVKTIELLPAILNDEDTFTVSEDESEVLIQRGSARTYVSFIVDEENDPWVIFYSPLVFLPKDNLLPFYRALLDLNYEMMPGRLATHENFALLKYEILVEHLSDQLFRSMLYSMTRAADYLDDRLIKEFGVRRWEPPE